MLDVERTIDARNRVVSAQAPCEASPWLCYLWGPATSLLDWMCRCPSTRRVRGLVRVGLTRFGAQKPGLGPVLCLLGSPVKKSDGCLPANQPADWHIVTCFYISHQAMHFSRYCKLCLLLPLALFISSAWGKGYRNGYQPPVRDPSSLSHNYTTALLPEKELPGHFDW